MKGILRDLRRAYEAAEKAANSHSGDKYARGLASEGYAGGYLQALRDVEAALKGYSPSGSRYWPQD